jgi:hypothetical protein
MSDNYNDRSKIRSAIQAQPNSVVTYNPSTGVVGTTFVVTSSEGLTDTATFNTHLFQMIPPRFDIQFTVTPSTPSVFYDSAAVPGSLEKIPWTDNSGNSTQFTYLGNGDIRINQNGYYVVGARVNDLGSTNLDVGLKVLFDKSTAPNVGNPLATSGSLGGVLNMEAIFYLSNAPQTYSWYFDRFSIAGNTQATFGINLYTPYAGYQAYLIKISDEI